MSASIAAAKGMRPGGIAREQKTSDTTSQASLDRRPVQSRMRDNPIVSAASRGRASSSSRVGTNDIADARSSSPDSGDNQRLRRARATMSTTDSDTPRSRKVRGVIARPRRKAEWKTYPGPLQEWVDTARTMLGIDNLRPGQAEALTDVMDGHDVLAVMPTGSGKSLIYQLTSLMSDGLTVVVSPLIALIKDQIDKMIERGVPVCRFDSTLTVRQRRAADEFVKSPGGKLVFVTPEAISKPEFRAFLRDGADGVGVSHLVVDEAHCVSQWGHDFRPAYLSLRKAVEDLDGPSIIAVTATAPPHVRDDIVHQLGIPNAKITTTSFDRPNLHFEVIAQPGEDEKQKTLVTLLKKLPTPGIVYCATVKKVEQLYESMARHGIKVARYHGRLGKKERDSEQQRFMESKDMVMIATNAFGLGVDKSNIRNVLHYHVPGSLEAYAQEAGRAGRDGKPARCVLLFSPDDIAIQEYFLKGSYPTRHQVKAVYKTMTAWVNHASAPPTISNLALASRVSGQRTRTVLSLLKDEGFVIEGDNDTFWLAEPQPDADLNERAKQYEARRIADRQRLDALLNYVKSATCRNQALLDYLGESDTPNCGRCDNCLRSREAALAAAAQATRLGDALTNELNDDWSETETAPKPRRIIRHRLVRIDQDGQPTAQEPSGERGGQAGAEGAVETSLSSSGADAAITEVSEGVDVGESSETASDGDGQLALSLKGELGAETAVDAANGESPSAMFRESEVSVRGEGGEDQVETDEIADATAGASDIAEMDASPSMDATEATSLSSGDLSVSESSHTTEAVVGGAAENAAMDAERGPERDELLDPSQGDTSASSYMEDGAGSPGELVVDDANADDTSLADAERVEAGGANGVDVSGVGGDLADADLADADLADADLADANLVGPDEGSSDGDDEAKLEVELMEGQSAPALGGESADGEAGEAEGLQARGEAGEFGEDGEDYEGEEEDEYEDDEEEDDEYEEYDEEEDDEEDEYDEEEDDEYDEEDEYDDEEYDDDEYDDEEDDDDDFEIINRTAAALAEEGVDRSETEITILARKRIAKDTESAAATTEESDEKTEPGRRRRRRRRRRKKRSVLPPKSAFTSPVLSKVDSDIGSYSRGRRGRNSGGGPVIEYVRGPMRINMTPVASATPNDVAPARKSKKRRRPVRNGEAFFSEPGGTAAPASVAPADGGGGGADSGANADGDSQGRRRKRRRKKRRRKRSGGAQTGDGTVSFFSSTSSSGWSPPQEQQRTEGGKKRRRRRRRGRGRGGNGQSPNSGRQSTSDEVQP